MSVVIVVFALIAGGLYWIRELRRELRRHKERKTDELATRIREMERELGIGGPR
jgi:hypothetical protein